MTKKRIALISTGGTIEKTYCETHGVLDNQESVLDVVLAGLRLGGTELVRVPLLNKDSLDMTERDHALIAQTATTMAAAHDGVVVVHGTDRLAVTGEHMVARGVAPEVPVVLTGAMRPYMLRNTDALQNLTEALLAVQMLAPGVYCVMHSKVLQFPGVVKDKENNTFVRRDD
ncbi:MAG: asparaginase domain-containing protein [Planctomycetota bacterium]